MNLKDASLIEIAALASKELEAAGIKAAVVGGSAVTAYVPDVYTSHDIDFAAINGASRREFGAAVAKLGFHASGRDYVNPDVEFSLDLVADTPYVDQRAIKDFTTMPTRFGPVWVLQFEDAIADRIAAFLHWSDSQSLEVAERAVRAYALHISWKSIERALDGLDSSGADGHARLALAKRRLKAAAKVERSSPE
jgi:hypothetical protein